MLPNKESRRRDSPPAAGRISDTVPFRRSAIPRRGFCFIEEELSYKAKSPPPVKRVARLAGYNPLTPDSVSRRTDFLSVQVTIALDALLIPLKGRLYYFDLTLKRVFIFFYT